MSSVLTMAAEMTKHSARHIAANLKAMPPDKQVWRPLDAGRSALSLAQECAVMNRYAAQTLLDRKAPPFDFSQYEAACAALDTADKALAELDAATSHLVEVILDFPEEDLETRIPMPWAEGFTMSFLEIVLMSYWNMTYHEGQMAYIQTLYGDTEMHPTE